MIGEHSYLSPCQALECFGFIHRDKNDAGNTERKSWKKVRDSEGMS